MATSTYDGVIEQKSNKQHFTNTTDYKDFVHRQTKYMSTKCTHSFKFGVDWIPSGEKSRLAHSAGAISSFIFLNEASGVKAIAHGALKEFSWTFQLLIRSNIKHTFRPSPPKNGNNCTHWCFPKPIFLIPILHMPHFQKNPKNFLKCIFKVFPNNITTCQVFKYVRKVCNCSRLWAHWRTSTA